MNGEEAYVLSKALTASAAAGIKNYEISDSGLLTMETADGEILTYQFREPEDGVSVDNVEINANQHVICTMSDGTTIDAGAMPTVKMPSGGKKGQALVKKSSTDGDVEWKTIGGGGGGSAELTDELTTSVAVGGIPSGTTYEIGTSLEDLFRDMLNPVAYPTLTNPSASLSATGAKLLETGASLTTTFTITFNRGSINPQYTAESPYRAGAATSYTLDGETKDTNTFTRTITSAKTSYQGSVAYAAGVQPKDSVGNDYNSPLPAGSVNTGNVNYEFVDAMWSNVANIGTIAKMALVSKSSKQRDMNFPAQTVANPETFDIPDSWNVTAVQVKNDLSGAYEDALSQFTVTDVTHDDAAENSVAYKRYTFNLGYPTGARSVRVKWS